MPAEARSHELALAASRAAADAKGQEIVALDVSERMPLTDVFVLVQGNNDRHVRSLVDAVDKAMHDEGIKLVRSEGRSEHRWVLLDYGNLVVHVQQPEDREFYSLERLWKDCPAIPLPADLYGWAQDGAE
ncbi:MAG TPA: ribosome silencing factor [Actinomycetaceae bacterium]|nr:ribosome silencing factor [Actinomycetaceae bacterium]